VIVELGDENKLIGRGFQQQTLQPLLYRLQAADHCQGPNAIPPDSARSDHRLKAGRARIGFATIL